MLLVGRGLAVDAGPRCAGEGQGRRDGEADQHHPTPAAGLDRSFARREFGRALRSRIPARAPRPRRWQARSEPKAYAASDQRSRRSWAFKCAQGGVGSDSPPMPPSLGRGRSSRPWSGLDSSWRSSQSCSTMDGPQNNSHVDPFRIEGRARRIRVVGDDGVVMVRCRVLDVEVPLRRSSSAGTSSALRSDLDSRRRAGCSASG